MSEILVKPCDVWNYYIAHKGEANNRAIVIARNKAHGVEVCISGYGRYVTVSVMMDEELIHEDDFDASDAEEVIREIYKNFVEDDGIEEYISGAETAEQMDEIETREEELDLAVFDLLQVFCDNLDELVENADEVYEDMKDLICETLYKKYHVSVRRPMFLEDEDGNESYEEFPYDEMEMDE